MTMTATSKPRAAALPREVAMRLAAAEYQRFVQLLRGLRPEDWTKPTECAGWGCPGDGCACARDGRNGRVDW